MARNYVSIEGLSDAISTELKVYSTKIYEALDIESRDATKNLVKKTKATAPVGNRDKHYRDNITYKRLNYGKVKLHTSYLWYVKGSDYRLSHLLEKGHATRDGGRVPGTHFISNASEPILADYVKRVEEIIKNGG